MTWMSTPSTERATSIVTVEPGGAASRALETRLSRICSSRARYRPRRHPGRRATREPHSVVARDRRPRLGSLCDDRRDVDVGHVMRRRVETGEDQEGLHESTEPCRLAHGRLEPATVCCGDAGAKRFQAKPERSERGAQLMRRVGDEAPLRVDELREPLRGEIEGRREVAQLRRAFVGRHADSEIAEGHAMCGLLHPADGTAHAAGHHDADRGHHEQHERGQHAEADPVGPHPSVEGRRRVGDAHRPVHDAIGDDGDRDEDETRAGGLRVAHTVGSAATERRLDLRSVGEVLRRPPDHVGIGHAHPRRIDDHDPSAVGAVVGEHRVELRGDAALEVVLGRVRPRLARRVRCRREDRPSLSQRTRPRRGSQRSPTRTQ